MPCQIVVSSQIATLFFHDLGPGGWDWLLALNPDATPEQAAALVVEQGVEPPAELCAGCPFARAVRAAYELPEPDSSSPELLCAASSIFMARRAASRSACV